MVIEGEPMKEPTLFGQPKYEVESAAKTLQEARELERTKPALYAAAIKQLKRQQNAIGDVLRAVKRAKGKS